MYLSLFFHLLNLLHTPRASTRSKVTRDFQESYFFASCSLASFLLPVRNGGSDSLGYYVLE